MKYHFLRYPGGKDKAVTFSYDDGCRHDIRLAETLTRYGIKCTFNLNSGLAGNSDTDWHLTVDEIKAHIASTEHEIAVHGKYHRAPGLCRSIDVIRDMLDCRLELEQTYDRIIRGMAYPDSGITNFQNGSAYDSIRRNLQDIGIVYSRTLGGDNNRFTLPSDWYAWMPTAHHINPNALTWAKEFVKLDVKSQYSANRYPRLFYLWGHSYEFHNNNNWDLLDALCQELGGKDDIWYATNMEIWAYVHAYESLIFSADETKVHNPTLVTLWMDVDGKLFRIAPGETVLLA